MNLRGGDEDSRIIKILVYEYMHVCGVALRKALFIPLKFLLMYCVIVGGPFFDLTRRRIGEGVWCFFRGACYSQLDVDLLYLRLTCLLITFP